VVNLSEIVCEEVRKYAGSGRGLDLRLYFLRDDDHHVYAVNAIDDPSETDEEIAGVVVMARVVEDRVVIETDASDKPLSDALMQRGIERDHIILAYQGEARPD
jgi:hypothetical protein